MSNIIDEVKEKVFPLFEKGMWGDGARILRKISFNIDTYTTTEEKRIVYYNLAWVLDEMGQVDMAKTYVLMIKNIIEEDVFFIKENKDKYCMVLKLYEHLFGDKDLTIDEQIQLNEEIYNTCKKNTETLDQALVSKGCIYFIKHDYEGIVDLIEMIHNYKITKKINGKDLSPQVLNKIDKVQGNMINRLKRESLCNYDNLIDDIHSYAMQS